MAHNRLKLCAIAAAVTAAYAGGASAQTVTGTFYGAGASAALNSEKAVVLTGPAFCNGAGNTAAGTVINVYEGVSVGPVGGGSVVLISCNVPKGTGGSIQAITGPLNVGYDSSGGSWKAFQSISTTLFNLSNADGQPNASLVIDTANLAKCTTVPTIGTQDSYSGVYINDFKNCPIVTATSQPTFGLTDVPLSSFVASQANWPIKAAQQTTFTNPPGTALLDGNFAADVSSAQLSGYPQSVFGVVFGVAVNHQLLTALQNDQIASLPATCTLGTVGAACAPTISRAQYRSLFTETPANNLNSGNVSPATGIKQLFATTTPADLSVTLARRDQGSGTQASSNDYIFNLGFGLGTVKNTDLAPALPTDSVTGYTVQYNNSTTNVIDALTVATGNIIGWVSAEKDGSFNGGAGFIKLDGVYPSNTNAALCTYNVMSQETVHANPAVNATFIAAFVAAAKTYHATGIVPFLQSAAGTQGSGGGAGLTYPALNTDSKGNPTVSYCYTNDNNVTGLRSW